MGLLMETYTDANKGQVNQMMEDIEKMAKMSLKKARLVI